MPDCLSTLPLPEAIALGHEAIDLLGSHQIAPTPQNYEVWVSYRLGAVAALRVEIDERLARGLPFDEAFCEEIHERFFSQAKLNAKMAETGEQIAHELSTLLAAVAAADDQAKIYSGDLERAARTLQQRPTPEGLAQVAATLASATLKMLGQNRDLSEQLNKSSRSMDTMRKTLKQARAEAMTDGLTGLANRRLFDETLRAKLREFRAAFGPMTLALIDIDHFKRFNDTWGHQTGDQIIRFVAATLQRFTPAEGLAARYGGEEFAMILPSVTLPEAKALAERVRVAIESKTLVRRATGEDLGRITVSIGVALLSPVDTLATLVERADACLYHSKRAGRNRVTTEADQAQNAA